MVSAVPKSNSLNLHLLEEHKEIGNVGSFIENKGKNDGTNLRYEVKLGNK